MLGAHVGEREADRAGPVPAAGRVHALQHRRPGNPYALVYDRRRIERDFPSFRVTRTYKRFMHAPPLPVHRLPGQSLAWHQWAHLVPDSA